MEKIISHPNKVEDLFGLFTDLQKSGFAVRNVGADQKGTYVYLEESEEKNPFPVMEKWLGKPVPVLNKQETKKRLKEAGIVKAAESKPSFVRRILGAFRRAR